MLVEGKITKNKKAFKKWTGKAKGFGEQLLAKRQRLRGSPPLVQDWRALRSLDQIRAFGDVILGILLMQSQSWAPFSNGPEPQVVDATGKLQL